MKISKIYAVFIVLLFAISSAYGSSVKDPTADLFLELTKDSAGTPWASAEKVRQFVKAGANVNLEDVGEAFGYNSYTSARGITMLMTASIYQNNPEIIHILVNAGADVNARSKENSSWRGQPTPLLPKGLTALMVAAGKQDPIIHTNVSALIEAGADVNLQDEAGFTALMYAAYFNYYEVVKAILDAKPDVNMQDNYGRTALMLAVVNENDIDPQVVKALIDAGARADIKDNAGKTALDYAYTGFYRGKDKEKVMQILQDAL